MNFAKRGPGRFFGWLYRRLEARRTAVISVSIVTGLLVLSRAVPQRGDFAPPMFAQLLAGSAWLGWADRLGLTDIFRSAPMLGAFTVLLLNLWLSFATRLEHMRREVIVTARPATAKALARAPLYRAVAVPAGAEGPLERLRVFLETQKYATDVAGGALRAMRNRYSVYGSVLFHLSFLLLLAGMALRLYTSFHGSIIMGVGESFLDRPAVFSNTQPRYVPPERIPDIRFRLDEFYPVYYAGESLSDAVAILNIAGRQEEVRVNYPAHFGPTTLRLVDFGFAPVFIIRETDKRLKHTAAVRLQVLPPGRRDSFSFPALPVTFTTRLYPDYEERDGSPASRSLALKRAAAVLEFVDDEGAAQELLLKQGQVRQIGRYEFEMPEIVFWCRFAATRDGGRWLIYVSFIVGFVGLAWRMLLPRKRIDACVEPAPEGATLHVAGYPDYTKEPFGSEFAALVDRFASSLVAGRSSP